MAEASEITLGGCIFKVRPLTLDQIIDICPLLQAQAAGFATKESANAMVEIVAAMLRRDNPEMTPDAIRQMEILPVELSKAVTVALELCGLVKKDAKPGEVEAGA